LNHTNDDGDAWKYKNQIVFIFRFVFPVIIIFKNSPSCSHCVRFLSSILFPF
jgi:hypothetical protein